jgi:uncharacterized membrane protein
MENKKSKNIAYWAVTGFLCFGMLAGGIQQLLQIGGYNEIVTKLGYPLYLLSIIGTWKILGVVAILIPKYKLVKEWAYAGFFFVMTGAAISHFTVGQSFVEAMPAIILLAFTVASWYLRPADRSLIPLNSKN